MLKIGQKIKVITKTNEKKRGVERNGVIAYLYPDHFVVRFQDYNVSYKYADIITSEANLLKRNSTIIENQFLVIINRKYELVGKDMIPKNISSKERIKEW